MNRSTASEMDFSGEQTCTIFGVWLPGLFGGRPSMIQSEPPMSWMWHYRFFWLTESFSTSSFPWVSAIFVFSSAISFNIFSTIFHLPTIASHTFKSSKSVLKHLYKSSKTVIPVISQLPSYLLSIATFQSEDILHIEGHL